MTEDERATFVKDELATIGTFYDAISATFTQLVTDGKDVFIPDPVQVGDDIGVLKMPVDTKKTPDTAAKTFTPEERLTQALTRIIHNSHRWGGPGSIRPIRRDPSAALGMTTRGFGGGFEPFFQSDQVAR